MNGNFRAGSFPDLVQGSDMIGMSVGKDYYFNVTVRFPDSAHDVFRITSGVDDHGSFAVVDDKAISRECPNY